MTKVKKDEEKNFLDNYKIENYDRPSVATDIAVFTMKDEDSYNYRQNNKSHLSILLIRRGEYPFLNKWALPGGFLRQNETLEECAYREIKEETNIIPNSLMLVDTFSAIDRDPRGRIISNAYLSIVGDDLEKEKCGGDSVDVRWFEVSLEQKEDNIYELKLTNEETLIKSSLKLENKKFNISKFKIIDPGELAFDHAQIISTALMLLKNKAENYDIIFDFLPEKFTLYELQKVQEAILNISLYVGNFRRKISEYVTETDEYKSGAGHRPAKLFRRKC